MYNFLKPLRPLGIRFRFHLANFLYINYLRISELNSLINLENIYTIIFTTFE